MRNMKNADFIRGIGVGLVTASALTMAMGSGKRKRKRTKNHTIKAIGDVVDNVTDLIGL